jgi:hypothetical protein
MENNENKSTADVLPKVTANSETKKDEPKKEEPAKTEK